MSPVVLGCLAMMTAVFPVSLRQTFLFWHHRTTFFDVRGGTEARYQRARTRAMPAAVVGGIPFLVAAWLFVISPPAQHQTPNGLQLVALVCAVLAAIMILGIVPSIYFLNTPKRLVPPHLRDQPGLLREGR